MTKPTLYLAALSVALAALVACGEETTAPVSPKKGTANLDVVPETQLHFTRPAPGAPLLAQKQVSFYAVRGQDREAAIWYHPHPGVADSNRLVRLKVRKESLVQKPDGTPIAMGDSLLITITVLDTLRSIVDCQPTGLDFDKPANLTMWYLEADHDFNDDGVIDAADTAIEATLKIWREENAGDPFESLQGVPTRSLDQIEVKISGFTRYVVAY